MTKRFYLYCLDFPNGKKYIGLTGNLSIRFKRHRQDAKYGSKLLVHAAMRKYGFPPYRILCIGDRDYIVPLEIVAIRQFCTRAAEHGYNISLGGDLPPTMLPEIAARAAAKRRGSKRSAETRARMSAAGIGRPISAKTRAIFEEANKHRNGRKHTSETRAKMSAVQKGHPGIPWTLEQRQKSSIKHKGKVFTPAHRAAIGVAHKGRVKSTQECANISAAKKGKPAWNKGIPGSTRPKAEIHALSIV